MSGVRADSALTDSVADRAGADGATARRAAPRGDPGEPVFVDATAEAGLAFAHRNGMTGERWLVEIMGAGVALVDYDADGDLDVFLIQGGSLDPARRAGEAGDRLLRNELIGSGGAASTAGALRFVDVTGSAGLAESGYGMGVATGDYDGDGWPDLYVTNWGPNELWRNRGDGTFERRGAGAGVDDARWGVAAAFFDYDRDGDLDLWAGNYVDFSASTHKPCVSALGVADYCGPLTFEPQADVLFRNRGDGTFEDATGPAGLAAVRPRPALGAAVLDADGDGRLDLYVANDQTANDLWRNLGDGRFAEEALLRGCALSGDGKPQASMGVATGDSDLDGDEDLFLTHLTEEHHTLYANDGAGSFEDVSARAGLVAATFPLTGFGVGFLDYDNDGVLDLASVSGAVKLIPDQVAAGEPLALRQPGQLLHGTGDGRFTAAALPAGAALRAPAVGRGAALGDVDNDGDVDLVVTENDGPARLLRNDVGSRRSWLGLRVVEPIASGRDRDALGAWVVVRRRSARALSRRVHTAGSYASAGDPRLLFGLGEPGGAGADLEGVDVTWPDGTTESWSALEIGRYHVLRRGEGS
jgi:hypothetical protein